MTATEDEVLRWTIEELLAPPALWEEAWPEESAQTPEAVVDWLTGADLTRRASLREAEAAPSLDALAADATALRRNGTITRLKLELGKVGAVDAVLQATFLPHLADDPAAHWLRDTVKQTATAVKDLEGNATIAGADFEERAQNLRLRTEALFELAGVFFLKNYAAANRLPTQIAFNARYMADRFLEVYMLLADLYGKAGALGGTAADPRLRQMLSPALAARIGHDTTLQLLVAHLNEWHRNLVKHFDVLAKTNEVIRDHWATALVKKLDFTIEVAMNLTLPLGELVSAKLVNPAVFLAAMEVKYPGFRKAAYDLVEDMVELDRTAPDLSVALWELIDAATQGRFNPRKFIDSLARTTPEEWALIVSRMIYIAGSSANPWMLAVPFLVKKLLALPRALGGAFELLSAKDRIEYGLTQMGPATYGRARKQLADPAVQTLLAELAADALLVYKYWDTIMAAADYTGDHVAAEQSLRAMRETFK